MTKIKKTKIEYRTVDTSTLKGLEEAEKLHLSGWIMYGRGLFLTRFWKRVQ